MLDEYRAERRTLVKERTVHHESVVIKQFMKWCRRRQLVDLNPLTEYELSKPRPAKLPKPTIGQVNLVLAEALEPRSIQFAVLAMAGLRVGEMQHLLHADVDFDGNWLHIVSRAGARTKTGEDRKVPIHPRLRKLLEQFPRSRGKWFFTAASSPRFPAGDNWLNVRQLNVDFKKLLKALDIASGREEDGFTVHSLRGFFKSHCINCGVPREVVDTWQGHTMRSNPSDYYYSLHDEVSQAWMQRISFDE